MQCSLVISWACSCSFAPLVTVSVLIGLFTILVSGYTRCKGVGGVDGLGDSCPTNGKRFLVPTAMGKRQAVESLVSDDPEDQARQRHGNKTIPEATRTKSDQAR